MPNDEWIPRRKSLLRYHSNVGIIALCDTFFAYPQRLVIAGNPLHYLACSWITLLSVCFHIDMSPASSHGLLLSTPSLVVDRAHSTTIWPHLKYICKDPISKWSHMLGFCMDVNLGETLVSPVHLHFTGLWIHFLFQTLLFLLPNWGFCQNKVL